MKKQHTLVIAVLIVILITALIFTIAQVRKNSQKVNTETENIFSGKENVLTYTDINGNPIALENFLGRVVVVTTWASWSPFSEVDLNLANRLALEFDQQEVVFIVINRKETREQAQRYLTTLPALDNIIIVIDQEDFFYQSVQGYAMPETIVFDQKGEIVEHVRGTLNEEKIREVIKQNVK